VGRIGRAHGLRGEVAVRATTNRPERFAVGSVLWADGVRLTIVSSRPHQDRWLVCFEGIDDRTAAEQLLGAVLAGEPLGELPNDERWVHELIGTTVVDRAGEALGRVVSIEANPAHDLLVLDGGVLVPMVFIVDDRPDGRPGVVVVDVPPGLLDVNRPGRSE
jgi:16S rRNA processing protein RimM